MNGARISLLTSLEKRLKAWLTGHPDGHERGALLLFRKFDRSTTELSKSPRYVALDMIELDDDWVLESSPGHILINLRKLPEAYLRCEQENLELGFVHSHPSGANAFSTKDEKNERNILRGYAGCNGTEVSLISLVLVDDHWLARVRSGVAPKKAEPARHLSVIGDSVSIFLTDPLEEVPAVQKRQEAAFGKPFNQKLAALRVAVVGLGGTGSPLATLLARAGVGELILIDGDDIEDTNLNRVRGYRMRDVGSRKATVLRDFIIGLGMSTRVVAIDQYLFESTLAIDEISGCDFIFGCTDDVTGRDLLNQASFYYGIPYIDAGLTGRITLDEDGAPYLRDHRGRVSVVLPESGKCLRCQRIVTDEKLKYEEAIRARPELAKLDAETLRTEYYLVGGGEQAPGVGPFTSATADFAVAAFMNLIRPFRKIDPDLRQDNIWCDFVHMCIHSNLPTENPECFCCGTGGLKLASENGYRLGMPSLGRVN